MTFLRGQAVRVDLEDHPLHGQLVVVIADGPVSALCASSDNIGRYFAHVNLKSATGSTDDMLREVRNYDRWHRVAVFVVGLLLGLAAYPLL